MKFLLSLFIGWRYTKAKRRSAFVSFIALASMLGIALGITVLITVLSVMNGFDQQIRSRFFAVVPQLSVYTGLTQTEATQRLAYQAISKSKYVVASSPYVSGNAMLMSNSVLNGLQLIGVNPDKESNTSKIAQQMVDGSLNSLAAGQYNIVIGQSLANKIGVTVGDKVTIFTAQFNITLAGSFPRHRQFTVGGIFHASDGFGFDTSLAYLNIDDAAILFKGGQATKGYHVKLQDLYLAPVAAKDLQSSLPMGFLVNNWTQTAGAFFSALQMEKTMMFVILLLIIAVAVFNLVATLVMVVNDKRADIAILRTIGAPPSMVMLTFIFQGAIIGLIGTIIGVVCGVILSLNVTDLTNWIQHIFNIQLISADTYYVDYLPSLLSVADVIRVSVIAFVLSLLATLYPAWTAFKTKPAEALRYE